MADEPDKLGDYVEFPEKQGQGNQSWLVLFPEDYDNLIQDVQGNVGLLVDIEQAGEILSLSAEAIAYQSEKEADGTDVLDDFIAELESLKDD